MTIEDLNVDAARLANISNFFTESFIALGGWNTFGPVSFALVVFGVIGFWNRRELSVWKGNNFVTRWRERQRMERERRLILNQLVADIITDGLEDSAFEGTITDDEKLKVYADLSGRYPDLKRRKLALKDELTARLAAEKRDAAGKIIPAPLPKEEPGTTGTPVFVSIL